jgi:hypothetical protein
MIHFSNFHAAVEYGAISGLNSVESSLPTSKNNNYNYDQIKFYNNMQTTVSKIALGKYFP